MSENKQAEAFVSDMTAEISKNSWIRDFIGFKVMILPKIVIALYVLLTIVSIISGIVMIFTGNILGILVVLLAPFVNHIFFEFLMLPYAMLDTLREIRDRNR